MSEFKPKKALESIKSKPRELKNFLLQESPDRKLLLYFSMGYLSKMYLDHAEQMMKKGRGFEADHFTGKATQIREITRHIFGQFPEEDVYTQTLEAPEKWNPTLSEQEIQEMAQFCVSELPETPQIRDVEKLREAIIDKLSQYRRKGVVRRFVKQIKKSLDRWNNPNKLSTLLELMFLLDNVNEVLEAIKEETKEEEADEEEIFPGIKKGEEDIEELKD